MTDAWIIDAVRTPRSKKKGKLSGVHPVDLLTYPLNSLTNRNHISADRIEDVLVGCVTQAGEQSWCIGRAAVLAAGWPYTVPAATVNRLCGSGQQAINFIASGIQSNTYQLGIGAGVEHMTRCPMFSDGGGEESSLIKQFHPGLVPQGMSAELLSEQYKVSRADIDEFAYNSQMRAKQAAHEGRFKKSLIPVPYNDEHGNAATLSEDDTIRGETTIAGLSALKTVFKENGVITAGNASAIVDGAAAVLLSNEVTAKELKLKPRARVVASAAIGSPPLIMLSGPIEASRLALKRAGLSVKDIDVWEINEAFAPVPIITMRELDIDPQRVNVNGGGISLGHPLGATGAMLVGMALDELERTDKRYALITMCIGLGMGIATIIEKA
jgi:acetyl-CoA acetyltransferase family protein